MLVISYTEWMMALVRTVRSVLQEPLQSAAVPSASAPSTVG